MKFLISTLFWLLVLGAQAQKKNVLFIIVDDLKPFGKAYGLHDNIQTPNMDKLAKSGTLFVRNYTQQAVCAVSRISFLTGTRPDITKVWDLKTDMRTMVPNSLTLPEYFKQQGYTTVGMGKVFHGAKKDDPQSWSLKFIKDDKLTYAEGYELPVNRAYQNQHSRDVYNEIKKEFENNPTNDKIWRSLNKELVKQNARPAVESLDVPDDAYADGALANKGIKMMKRLKNKENPFFIAIGFHKPHLPFVAPKKYWDLYNRDEVELSKFREHAENSPEFAYHTYGEIRHYSDIPQDLGLEGLNGDIEKQKEIIHGYYASVSYVDAQIGKVLDYLKKSGLDKNTVVVLLGDHGWHLGDHGVWCKHTNFEQATHTPLMIRIPGDKKGLVCNSPTELLDIFPTLCDAVGIDKPATLQGQSLVPIISGQATKVKNFALSQYPRGNRMGYAIRNERYRYVEWHGNNYRSSQPYNESNIEAVELYDYKEDPLETKSVQNEPDYQEIKKQLKKELKDFLSAQENK